MKTITVILLMLLAQISFSQNSDWVYRNPNPQNDFYGIKFFNQSTGYVIGSGGTILKNTTGSNNWTTINGNTVNDLYGMYFFDVNHGYIVGAGGLIMNSTDGGATWTHIVADNRYALRSITFVNQNTGFLVGDQGELYRTTIGMYGWIKNAVTTKNLRCVFALDSLRIFACGDSGTFLRSTDGGSNWTTQILGNATNTCICFSNSLTGYMSTSSPSITTSCLRSTDSGLTWLPISFFRIGDTWGCVKFKNQDTGFFAGKNNLIMHTRDGGMNWYEQGVPQNTFLNDICLVDTLAFVCGNNGMLYETSVSGFTRCLGGSKENFLSILMLDANTGIMTSNYNYMRTTNGGENWNMSFYGWYSWEEGCADIQTAICSFTPLSVYRVTEDVNCHAWYSNYYLQNSTDGGVTWNGNRAFYQTNIGIGGVCESEGVTYITAALPNSTILKNSGSGWNSLYTGTYLGSLSFANQNTGVVCSNSPPVGILRTTNGGMNWVMQPTGLTRGIRDSKMLPSGRGYACGDSSFFERTTDFGATWTALSQNFVAYMNQIQFVSDNTGWAICQLASPPYDTRLYYTPNGGTNFMQLQSLENFKPNSVSFIDAYIGYVCGDSGVVLKTTNGGLTFTNTTASNLPEKFSLSQNYPNPFNPNTVIKFQVASSKFVKLIIYDVLGREVATLVNQQMQPGSYSVEWNGTNFPSGIYFYKLTAGDFIQSKKMVLIK